MNRQFTKLLIILNACFWLAVSFAVWKYSTNFPQQIVSTVVVLGTMAVLANLFYWFSALLQKNKGLRVNNWGYFVFILLSTCAQILLILFFLS
jgi:hypothetical protein